MMGAEALPSRAKLRTYLVYSVMLAATVGAFFAIRSWGAGAVAPA